MPLVVSPPRQRRGARVEFTARRLSTAAEVRYAVLGLPVGTAVSGKLGGVNLLGRVKVSYVWVRGNTLRQSSAQPAVDAAAPTIILVVVTIS